MNQILRGMKATSIAPGKYRLGLSEWLMMASTLRFLKTDTMVKADFPLSLELFIIHSGK